MWSRYHRLSPNKLVCRLCGTVLALFVFLVCHSRGENNIEADESRADFPLVTIPISDDTFRFQSVEHLLGIHRDLVFKLLQEVELPTQQVQDAANRPAAILFNQFFTFR